MSVLKEKRYNLKIAGEKSEVGVYIKEENGKVRKIEKVNIIQNIS